MNMSHLCTYIDGYFFMPTEIAHLKDQETTFEVSYDIFQEGQMVDNKRMYEIFLRAQVDEEGKEDKEENIIHMNTFFIKDLIENIDNTEQELAENEVFYVRVKFVKEIKTDKDTGIKTMVWDYSEAYPFAVSKKEN